MVGVEPIERWHKAQSNEFARTQPDFATTFPLVGVFPGSLVESTPMSARCQICGKGPSWGMSVSHSHVRTKRRWNPNIQRIRAIVGGAPKRLYVCTGCIKSGKVTKAGR